MNILRRAGHGIDTFSKFADGDGHLGFSGRFRESKKEWEKWKNNMEPTMKKDLQRIKAAHKALNQLKAMQTQLRLATAAAARKPKAKPKPKAKAKPKPKAKAKPKSRPRR